MTRLVVCLGLLLLASCAAPSGRSVDLGTGPDQIGRPSGRADIRDAVDGLIVGHRLMAAGEYEQALRAYHRSVSEQGVTVDVLSAIGSANLRLGRVGQAEQSLRRALELDQTFVPAHNNLGVALGEQGRWGEASLHFRNAFAFDSGRSDEIRRNYVLAVEKAAQTGYNAPEANTLSLIRRGRGNFLLLETSL